MAPTYHGLRSLTWRWFTIAMLSMLLLPCSVVAQLGETRLSNYTITSWGVKDGIPPGVIWGLAQDSQGYLWLATNSGLIRFDGTQFVRVQSFNGAKLPDVLASAVLASKDHSLWVGFSTGVIARIKDGRLVYYDVKGSQKPGLITTLAEDHSGAIWAGSSTGLLTFDGKQFFRLPDDVDVPRSGVLSIYSRENGDLYVANERGIFLRPVGKKFVRLEAIDNAPRFRNFAEDAQGRLWTSDPTTGFRQVGAASRRPLVPALSRGNQVLGDSSGHLWIATADQGIWRLTLEHGLDIQRLSIPGAQRLLQDRSGDIWAAAAGRLFRFSKSQVISLAEPRLPTAVEASPNGDLWVSTMESIFRVGQDMQLTPKPLYSGGRVTSMRGDSKGNLWVATNEKVIRIDARGRLLEKRIAELGLTNVISISAGSDDRLYLIDRDLGLFLWHTATRGAHPVPILSAAGLVLAFPDSRGRVWFIGSGGNWGLIETSGAVRRIVPPAAAEGTRTVYEDSRGNIWIGGFGGPYLFEGDGYRPVPESTPSRQNVTALSEDRAGNMWFTTPAGVECFRRGEIDAFLAGKAPALDAVVLDTGDGLSGMPLSLHSGNLIRARDGRFWVVTGDGLSVIDPSSVEKQHALSLVRVDSILVNDRAVEVPQNHAFSSGSNRVQVNYSALDLNSTHPVLFRYKLEGFDGDWIQAGTSRQAVYTHLPPGKYVFHVEARNSNGPWSSTAAFWSFSILPAFYQTTWFATLCVALLAAAVALGVRTRERRLRLQFAAVLAERFRLSRELHDTLLQGLVGAALHLHAASEGLDPWSAAHRQLVLIRKELEQIIREARRSIGELRSVQASRQDLIEELRSTINRSNRQGVINAQFQVHGKPFRATPGVKQQLVRIAQEAILNSVKHSGASELRLDVFFATDSIKLRIADDGSGFDVEGALNRKTGHYGLLTMRERAAQLNGSFDITSRAGVGTIVETCIRVSPAG